MGGLVRAGQEGDDMTGFVAQLADLRRRFPQLRPRRWVEGHRADGSFGVLWLTPQATQMTEADWNFPEGRFLAYVLNSIEPGDAPLYIVLNAAPADRSSSCFRSSPGCAQLGSMRSEARAHSQRARRAGTLRGRARICRVLSDQATQVVACI